MFHNSAPWTSLENSAILSLCHRAPLNTSMQSPVNSNIRNIRMQHGQSWCWTWCNCNATAVFPMSPISQWVACCSYPDMRCRNTGRDTGWGRQSPMPAGWRRQSRNGAARHRETTRIEAAQSLSQSIKKGHAKVTCEELWSTCHKSTFPNLVFMRNIHIHTHTDGSLSLYVFLES